MRSCHLPREDGSHGVQFSLPFPAFLSCLFRLCSWFSPEKKKATKPKQFRVLSHLFNSFFLPFPVNSSTQLSGLLECIFYLPCSNKEEELMDFAAFWTFPFCSTLVLWCLGPHVDHGRAATLSLKILGRHC